MHPIGRRLIFVVINHHFIPHRVISVANKKNEQSRGKRCKKSRQTTLEVSQFLDEPTRPENHPNWAD